VRNYCVLPDGISRVIKDIGWEGRRIGIRGVKMLGIWKGKIMMET